MEYVLVSDDCEICRYATVAFSVLRISLKNISEIKNEDFSNTIALLVCEHSKKKHQTKIKTLLHSEPISLITLSESNEELISDSKTEFVLKKYFSKYDLKRILNECAVKKEGKIKEQDISHPAFSNLIGKSECIKKIKLLIKQVAYTDSTVLIMGASGTGKDVIANCIHALSNRANNLFVPINCGAIPAELMESELFGHEKGAFTNAIARKPGRFEIATKGTLFLDEIGEMPLTMQVKLLRVIQDRKIERVGSNTSINVDVRLIAATNKNLELLVEEHKFREDLFYRLNVFPIYAPNLCERAEDIPLIMDHYIEKIFQRLHHRVLFTKKATELLCQYSWPGNVRELQNFLERMAILFPDKIVDTKNLDERYKAKMSKKEIEFS